MVTPVLSEIGEFCKLIVTPGSPISLKIGVTMSIFHIFIPHLSVGLALKMFLVFPFLGFHLFGFFLLIILRGFATEFCKLVVMPVFKLVVLTTKEAGSGLLETQKAPLIVC